MAEAPKHGHRRPRVTPQDLLDFVFDDFGFFLVGVPLAVVVLALWAWTPLAAVVALGDGVYLDDIVMLRLQDVSGVLFRDDNAYHHRAVAGMSDTIAAFGFDSGVGAADLLKAVSPEGDILAIHLETLKGTPRYRSRHQASEEVLRAALRGPRRCLGQRCRTMEVPRHHPDRVRRPVPAGTQPVRRSVSASNRRG